jgi:dihydrofolate reductase
MIYSNPENIMRNDLIMIAAVDRNWAIGKENKLLKPIPEDLKRFSVFTKGNIIIVGRKTLESFKDKKPLPNRINIIMTRNRSYTCPDAVIVNDMDTLNTAIGKYNKKIFVCGGESIYKQLLPYCCQALITKIDHVFEADAYAPNLDMAKDWICKFEGEWQTSTAGVRFKYVDYKRIQS